MDAIDSFIRATTLRRAHAMAAAVHRTTGMMCRVAQDAGRVSVICEDPAAMLMEYGSASIAPNPWVKRALHEQLSREVHGPGGAGQR